MKLQIQKWGNSLAVRVPKSFAVETSIVEGSTVDMTIEDGTLVLRPDGSLRLEDLLDKVTAENIHDEFDFGQPAGKEVW